MKRLMNPGLWITLLIVVALGLWPTITQNAATRELVFTILLAIGFASSLNILLGYTGYVSFGHVVFYGLGGYIGMYLFKQYNSPLWIAVPAGGLAAGLLAFILGKSILHLRGGYFALVTIGVNEAMRAFINTLKPFGGPTGIELDFSVYKPYGGAANALWLVYYTAFGLALLFIIISFMIKTSKFGLGLLSIREDEDAAEVMGVIAPNLKTWAFVLSAILPGMLGVLFFFKNGNVEPGDAFRLGFSIENLVMIMLGGQGTVLGPVLGAIVYQRLRGLLLVSPLFKNIQLSVSGVLLLVIVLFIPVGAVGWLRNRFPRLRRVLP